MFGILPGDKLVKNLRLPEADIKAKQLRDVRKARCGALQSLNCMGDEGIGVHKKKVPDQTVPGLDMSMKML